MKTSLRRLAFCATLALVALHPKAVYAQNQQEMNQQAEKDFNAADATLNEVYKQLTSKIDADSLEKLKAVQRIWIQFRDTEAQFEADLDARGGSMAPMIYNGSRSALTKTRTKELQALLKDRVN